MDWARGQRVQWVTLRVHAANRAARAIYDGLGFTVSATGSAGLAGVLADAERRPGPIAVIMSGVAR